MEHFSNSKYTQWYWTIVERRLENPAPKTEYREHHHIIPESFYIKRSRDGALGWLDGDADREDNLVWLTGREHALCHWLLVKMTKHNKRAYELMVYSFNMMSVGGDHQDRAVSRMITRAYERNRIEWSRVHSERMMGREAWNKGKKLEDEKYKVGGKKNKGRKFTPEINDAKSLRQLGSKRSEETKSKQSESAKRYLEQNPRGPMSEEEKQKRRDTQTGVPKHEGHGAKVAEANRGVVSINKDGVEKKVKRDVLQQWLDQGWQKGGRKRL